MTHDTLSPPIHDIRLLHDLGVPMRDGVRLSADVYLPRSPESFSTILTRTPYESGRDAFITLAVWFARRGYAFVIQDCRGRFESEGVFHAYAHDAEDGYDTLDWLAGQPWCDGKIGTWGRSYGGLTQWLPAPLASPHLSCMAPHVICDDFFSDCHYVGGAFQLMLSLGAAVIWETNMVTVAGADTAAIFQNRRFWEHLPLVDLDERAIGRKIPYWREWLEHPTYDDYWPPFNIRGRHDHITVPVFQQCGWYDPYTGAAFRNFNSMIRDGATSEARANQRVLVGPWTHEAPTGTSLGDRDFGPASLRVMREEDLRWFDYCLRGIDNGIGAEPPIRIFTMGVNQWRGEHEWPLARTQTTPYYIRSRGRANSLSGDGVLSPEPPGAEEPDRFDYDPQDPVPTRGGNLSVRLMSRHAEEPLMPGPVDQRPIERRDDVLVYTSSPLEEDLEVTGPIEAVIYAESSARDTDFTARLSDVDPTGVAYFVSEGILRARYRHGPDRTELLSPGVVEELRIEMCPTSIVFCRGHRIRLDISSSNFPRFSRNLNRGEDVATGTKMQVAHQVVLHSSQYPSHVLLPVIPA